MQIYTENTSMSQSAWQNLQKPFLNAVILSVTTCKPFYTEKKYQLVHFTTFYIIYVFQYTSKITMRSLTCSMH